MPAGVPLGPAAATGATAGCCGAFEGVAGATGRAAGTPAGVARCTRAAASRVTRCSSSAARSGARPAHSRRRLSSRACENDSSDRTAIPTSATNAAIAPIWVNVLDSESANGEVKAAIMNLGSV
jgi:hypothetical protein